MMKKLLVTLFIIASLFANAGQSNNLIKISSAGDVIPHLDVQSYALKTGGFDVLFDRFKGVLSKSDLSFANFEATINPLLKISGYPRFNTREGLMKALRTAGFNALSLANNHSLDTGSSGLIYTKRAADKYSFFSSGISLNRKEMFKPIFFKIKGVLFSYISLTTITNGHKNPGGENAAKVFIFNRQNKKTVLRMIRYAKRKSNFLIVSLHFGKEYKDRPGRFQKKLASLLVKNGVNLILGNHPHHIQRPEYIISRGTKALVSYSQGNFISHQNRFVTSGRPYHPDAKRGDTYVLNIYLRKSGNKVEIERVTYTPAWTLAFYKNGAFCFKSVILKREIENPLYQNQVSLLKKRRERIIEFMRGFEIEE
jgi:poly-gamma-glutamate synthesis protein (capsule biosynthesis protein)